MEYAAIRHFADKRYCFALEKGRFLIRLETKRGDAAGVTLHVQDKYLPIAHRDTRREYVMTVACSDQYRDYYEAVIDFDVVCLRYFFEIRDFSGDVAYYGNHSFYHACITDIGRMFDCPQTLREEEIFSLPGWAGNKVIYQIFPSRFATDKAVPEDVWYQTPIDHRADLKGSLRGIVRRLEYIRDLGADILYMTPVFSSKSSHKYDTDDYYAIDPSFGTKEDLTELVRTAHELGMYVILDGVFNHTSTDFFAFRDIREKGRQSPYFDWYYIGDLPLTAEPGKKPSYKTFSYVGGMPKLNLRNPAVADFVIRTAVYWIRECGIDGWRLDVADEIHHAFWKRFRREIKAVKEDALLVGEIWHFAGDFLEGDEWDSVMNYPFCHAVLDLVAEECISASEFMDRLGFLRGNLHRGLERYLWNFIDTHDTARFLYCAGHSLEKQKLAAALQILLPGMPMIYYGDEVAMDGDLADCRRGMLWDESRQNGDMLAYYRHLIRLRRQYPALTEGTLVRQYTEDETGLIYLERHLGAQRVILVFHTRAGRAAMPALRGRRDLLNGREFPGSMSGYEAAMLV